MADKYLTANSKLLELRESFRKTLPGRVAEISKLVADLNRQWHEEILDNLQLKCHGLAGSAGTFGAGVLGEIAQSAESCILQYREGGGRDELLEKLQEHTSLLVQAEINWKPGKDLFRLQAGSPRKWNNLIYVVDDDPLILEEMRQNLEDADYQVRTFTSPLQLHAGHEQPAVVIMDMMFKEDHVTGAKAILELKQHIYPFPAIVFFSVRKDIGSRLAAVRAGCQRYFEKPMDYAKLVRTLDGLTSKHIQEPYRVMIVDDDAALSLYYSIVLKECGMEVEIVNKPLSVLSILARFKPELILMDVHMPECSGLELAAAIRQDDQWAKIPIVFLSTEARLDKQLAAMHLGGDDFLTKPIDSHHLTQTLSARLKRTRWINRMDADLKNSLRESEFQRITLNQHALVIIADEEGRISFANEKFCELSGYAREELIGKDYSFSSRERHPADFFAALWKTVMAGYVWHGVICNRSKAGELFWVQTSIVPFLRENGVPYKFVFAGTDISAHMKSKRRAETAEKELRAIFENMQDIFFRTEGENVSMISPSVQQYTGMAAADLVGGPLARVVVGGNLEKMMQSLHDSGGELRDYEIPIISENGNLVMAVTCRRYSSPEGESRGIEGVMRDVSERNRLAADLENQRAAAEAANQAKSHFISAMSHELRTPLNAILGFAQLLQMTETLESTMDSVGEIVSAGNHMQGLINDVSDLARIEAGRVNLEIESVDVSQVVDECRGYLTPLAKEKSVELTMRGDPDMQVVNTDVKRLRQVILNLVSNAIKYNHAGGNVQLRYRAEGDMLVLDVIDTGIGISKENHDRVFKPFIRLATSGSVEGSGIGLAVTKNLVDYLGGEIDFNSRLGEGSHFWVRLPLHREVTRPDLPDQASVSERETKSDRRWRVLYVEDSTANWNLMEKLMEKRGNIDLYPAVDSSEAFAQVEKNKFDLILMDINLPGMSGYEIYDILKEKYHLEKTPVFAVSANAMSNEIKRGEAVFDAYISKPIDITRFMALLDEFLSESSSQ